jgi:hypothetical protein
LAFRFAFHVGISKIVWRTFASGSLATLLALCVLSTRIWITRISFYRLYWRRFGDTLSEWIADVVIGTRANGVMVHHITFGIDTTGSNTRISTLLLDTGLVRWTFSINNTFRSAIGWGSNVSRQARASLMTI